MVVVYPYVAEICVLPVPWRESYRRLQMLQPFWRVSGKTEITDKYTRQVSDSAWKEGRMKGTNEL